MSTVFDMVDVLQKEDIPAFDKGEAPMGTTA
jgi:hypothetical protein